MNEARQTWLVVQAFFMVQILDVQICTWAVFVVLINLCLPLHCSLSEERLGEFLQSNGPLHHELLQHYSARFADSFKMVDGPLASACSDSSAGLPRVCWR